MIGHAVLPIYCAIPLRLSLLYKLKPKMKCTLLRFVFFNSAVNVLQTLVVALGAGLGIWGAINLLEGYGNDNPGAKSQG